MEELNNLRYLTMQGQNALARPQENAFNKGLMELAMQKYPMLRDANIAYKYNPQPNRGMLEFWPPGETGAGNAMRPADIPMNKLGLEVYDKRTRPDDIMADYTSHHLIDNDPTVGAAYRQFLMSMNPAQQKRLQDQYAYAVKNYGEQRPFNQWAEMSGQPGWLRGYSFGQWEKPEEIYTQEQMNRLDAMVNYLRGNNK